MLAASLLEMVPEAMAINPHWAPLLILAGYCGVHLLEHTLVPHFHFGEETHHHDHHGHGAHGVHITAKTSYSVLFGLATHTFFDGVAIGSGFALSSWLGWILFFAVFLHKIPEGFTVASVMMAGGRGKSTALNSALFLGATTVAGVLVISLLPSLVRQGLPLSAGVTIYVAATDLVPASLASAWPWSSSSASSSFSCSANSLPPSATRPPASPLPCASAPRPSCSFPCPSR
jgi:ZIP family zinc transporter/zinc and cadmium transporter